LEDLFEYFEGYSPEGGSRKGSPEKEFTSAAIEKNASL